MQEIRKIALEYYTMDSYMKALLTIMRTVDSMYLTDDPLLKRFFSKEEYTAAKEKLSSLTDVRDTKKKTSKNQVGFDGIWMMHTEIHLPSKPINTILSCQLALTAVHPHSGIAARHCHSTAQMYQLLL